MHLNLPIKLLSVLFLILFASLPALATPGRLTASDTNSRINLRSSPSTQSRSLGYGLPGDQVEIVDYVTDSTGYLVRFNQSGAEGWIRSDFVQVDPERYADPEPQNTPVDPRREPEPYQCHGGTSLTDVINQCPRALCELDNLNRETNNQPPVSCEGLL